MATAGDLGLDLTPDGIAAMDRLNELEDVTIEVGYQADQKAADGETSLAEIAYWNHYGTVHQGWLCDDTCPPFYGHNQKAFGGTFGVLAAGIVLSGHCRCGCQRDRLAGEVHDSRSDKRRRMDSKCADNG